MDIAINTIKATKGINGVMLVDDYGDTLSSTINNERIRESLTLLAGILPTLEEILEIGSIQHIMVKTPHDGNLSVFGKDGHNICIQSEARFAITGLSQKLLQALK